MEGDQDFRKDLLHPGVGDIPLFQKKTKAIFHFRTYRPKLEGDSLVPPDQDEVIDDTRKLGNGPFELLMGCEFKLDIWYDMVKTMRVNEVARFTCPFKRIFEYPRVSKALREIALKRVGKDPPQQHQCSFAAMQQGTGYPDLDSIMQDATPLCFELELLRVEQPGEYREEYWAMTDEEKSRAIPRLKEEGNALYKQGNHQGASQKYFEALSYLEGMVIKEKPQSESWLDITRRKVPLLLNYAQCKLLMGDYAETIRHTTSVLEVEEDNVKALYRRGRAHAACWNVEEAQRDLRRVAELDPSLGGSVERELRGLAQRVREKDSAERERLKGKMFT